MTGFGVGRATLGQGRIVVEVRSVNHRFLDVRVRAPRELADLTMHVEQTARKTLRRGRFEIVLRSDGVIGQLAGIDLARASALYQSLVSLRDSIAPAEPVPFSMLASVPEIFVADNQDQHEAAVTAAEQALTKALEAADVMRATEGAALRADLIERLVAIRKHTGIIVERRNDIVSGYRKRLRERLQRLLADFEFDVDPSRLEQEVVVMADRCDVQEELTRLESHFCQVDELSACDEPVGRRLDFLLQEMVREVNTIGAKSQDAPVAHAVVEIKAEIERMREQVQNVE